MFRYRELAVLSLLATCSVSGCSDNGQPPVERTTGKSDIYREERVPGEYIVTLSGDVSDTLIRELFEEYAVTTIENLGRGRFLIRLEYDPGPQVIERIGAESPSVEHIQPNYIYQHKETDERQ